MAKLRYPIAECKFVVAKPVNTYGLPGEWAQALEKIQAGVSQYEDSHEVNKIRSILCGFFIQSLRWLVKEKWMPSLRLGDPAADGNERNAQKLGQHFRAILELCERCHTLESEYSKPYKNASEWLMAIVLERFENEVRETCRPVSERRGRARDDNKAMQEEIKLLKHHYKNPFDASKLPHLSRLIDCSIELFRYNKDAWELYMIGETKDRKAQKNNGLGFLRTYQKLKSQGSRGLPPGVKSAFLALENGKAVFSHGYRKGETIPELPFISFSEAKPI